MSCEDLIRTFWLKDGEYHFTPTETRMYFVVLKLASEGSVSLSDDEMSANVGVCVVTIRKSRSRLADAGLFVVVAGNGRGCKTEYKIEIVPHPSESSTTEEVKPVEVQEAAHTQPTEEVKEEQKPKRTRTTKPKDGDLFGRVDMRPKRKAQESVKPPDMVDVVNHFRAQGVDKEQAEMFYYHYDSLGWITSNGVKVKRWQSLANKWITKDKEKQKEDGSSIDSGSAFKHNIAQRIAEADRKYREAARNSG